MNYLESTIVGQRLDLVVSVGGPAAVFARKYRERLFPTTPLLETALDERFLTSSLSEFETAVAGTLDMGLVIDNLLLIRPETETVFAVIGTTDFENFWRAELTREFERFKGRPKIVWLHELAFADVLKRVATLPPNSAVFYLAMALDGIGILQSDEGALGQIREVANAPVLGIYDFQLGHGILGGPLIAVTDMGKRSAEVALRLLAGEPPAGIRTPVQMHGAPTYDWRELQRWGIDESRLPANSTVMFREPGLWEEYEGYFVSAALLVLVQSGLIAMLLAQRRERERAERDLRESEERFRRLANGLPVMVWTARPDTTLDFVNDTIGTFTGLPVTELLNLGWLSHIHPDDVEHCQSIYLPAVEARRPFQMEYRLRRADGRYAWVLDSGIPRYEPDGSFAGYVGSAIDITERREMELSLVDNQAELRRSYEQNQDLAGRLINAQEAERTRIARDLHDDVSQQLAGVGIMLSGLKRNLRSGSPFNADATMAALQERTATLAHAIRHLSHDLHPGVLKHAGLAAALTQHCEEVQRHHSLTLVVNASDDLDSLEFDVALCLYRVTQEALANIVRHAGASMAQVDVTRTHAGVELRIVDQGVGFIATERARAGLGLRSIDERVRLAGGTVMVISRPGQGTTLLVQIPLQTVRVEPSVAM